MTAREPSAACVPGDAFLDMVRVLVDAGATPASAARAAIAIDNGASIRDAYDLIEQAAEPATFDAELLPARTAA